MDSNFVTIAGSAFVAAIIVVGIWQFAAIQRAKGSAAREEIYRKLAEQSIAAQQGISEALGEIRLRLEAIEKLLREVD